MASDKIIILGGARFWCTQAIFQQLRGVSHVTSGFSECKFQLSYSGDNIVEQADRIEVVRISFDPAVISLAKIIRIHLRTHNPTTELGLLDDAGHHYRSIIFYEDEVDRDTIVSVIGEMQTFYEHRITTEIAPLTSFEKAGNEDQDYYKKNKGAPYCTAVIALKLEKFRELFADRLKE